MQIHISPSHLSGTIQAPPSKSLSHRAIILASLAHGTSVISNVLASDDIQRTLAAMQAFGVKIDVIPTTPPIIPTEVEGSSSLTLKIHGTGGNLTAPKHAIHLGLSGSSMRLLTGVATLAKGTTTLTGEKRLLERPMEDLLVALRSLGITTDHQLGTPPTVTGGELLGGSVEVPGNISSQFISAILLIAPFAKTPLTITTKDLRSKPYVDITIEIMKTFGVQVEQNAYETFTITPQPYKATNHTVEGDWSSASYFFAANVITQSKVEITGLNLHSKQADRAILPLLSELQTPNSQTTLDMGQSPDIVQTVAVVAAFQKGITTITNIGHLRFKETNRNDDTKHELEKLDIRVENTPNSLTIHGGTPHSATIKTYNDHRMAMSFAIAGLAIEGGITIENAEVVSKSYPNFWEDLESIGAHIRKH